jgi:hypothetical protein
MKRIITPLLLIAAINLASASDVKIAVINSDEIIDMIKTKVLAKPENAEAKKLITEIEARLAKANEYFTSVVTNEEKRPLAMAEMQKINCEKMLAEKSIEAQVNSEYIQTVKDVIKGKYILVLNYNYIKEAIVTKNAELVDITIDVKESLLVK